MAECGMEEYGRLIRTSNDRKPPKSIAYIVALSDPADAIELIRSKVADLGDKVEDIGRVSEGKPRSSIPVTSCVPMVAQINGNIKSDRGLRLGLPRPKKSP